MTLRAAQTPLFPFKSGHMMQANAENGNDSSWGGETVINTSEEPVGESEEEVESEVEAEATAFDEVRRPAKLVHHADVFSLFFFRPQRVS